MKDEKFEFLGVSFTREEAQLLLETAGYVKFELEYGRGSGGYSELKLCCNHPNGRRLFAEHAWQQERDAMIKRLLLGNLKQPPLPIKEGEN
jgi:hypothetical protein